VRVKARGNQIEHQQIAGKRNPRFVHWRDQCALALLRWGEACLIGVVVAFLFPLALLVWVYLILSMSKESKSTSACANLD